MKKTLSLLAFATLAAAAAFAQSSGSTAAPAPMRGNGVQHRVSFMTTLLTLTTAQQQQATTIFTNAGSAAATLHSSMKAAHETLKTAETGNDAATIDQTATTIGNLTAQFTSIEAKAEAAFYLILTPEQQTKLTQYESQGHGMGGAMGPAGFHGGPR